MYKGAYIREGFSSGFYGIQKEYKVKGSPTVNKRFEVVFILQ